MSPMAVRISRYYPGVRTGAATAPRRAAAVDALRGLMILGMVLYFAQPYEVLPSWMYHAQEPPPTHAPNFEIAGLTWPDIVFPIFIFTLGVAIPLSLGPRLERGVSRGRILAGALLRGALLMFFAVFRQHFDSATAPAEPDQRVLITSLAAFVVLFGIFVRLPDAWPRAWRTAVRALSWLAALGMLAAVPAVDGAGFRPEHIDGILVVLAYCAVFGTAVWVVTQHSLIARLAALALIVWFRLLDGTPGWAQAIYELQAPRWLYNASNLHYLCIVIPGTIIGDTVLRWLRHPSMVLDSIPLLQWPRATRLALIGLLASSVPLLVLGVTGRYVFGTTVAAAVLCAFAGYVTFHHSTQTESVLAQLVRWGSLWLLLGLLLDPYEGGTRKLPPTFSWFFICTGLGTFLIAMLIVTSEWLQKSRVLRLLADTGQNPMIAYVGYGMIALPLLGLSGINDAIYRREPGPWALFAWGVVVTLVIAFMVQFFTRRRLFWRT
jgi:predicted acyltransferase